MTDARTSGSAAESTVDRIVRVAAGLFYESGYHGTSMRDIARAAGMKAGSLYNHFEGKQELLLRICEDTVRELFDGALERLEGVEGVERRLRVFVLWHVEYHARHRFQARVADEQLHALDPDNRALVVELRDRYETLLQELVGAGRDLGGWRVSHVGVVSSAIATMCTQVDAWYRPDGELTPEQIGAIYADFVLAALRGDGAPAEA
jgi:AcrR family transcriptional regulator